MKFNPLVINFLDAFRYWNMCSFNAIVFDDCHWPDNIIPEDLVKLIDSELPTTHNIKHKSMRIVFATPRFVITNYLKPWEYNQASLITSYQQEQVKRRIKLFNVLDAEKFWAINPVIDSSLTTIQVEPEPVYSYGPWSQRLFSYLTYALLGAY